MAAFTPLLRATIALGPLAFVLGSLFFVNGPAVLWIVGLFAIMASIMLVDSQRGRNRDPINDGHDRRLRPSPVCAAPHSTR